MRVVPAVLLAVLTMAPALRADRPSMLVRVLDAQGQPLAGANVHVGIWTDEKDFKANRDVTTDADGAARVELPKTMTILRLWASKPGFAGLFANWERSELAGAKAYPAEYTFRLERGVTAGGRVVDEQGQPVAGAKVEVMAKGDLKPAGGDGRASYNTWIAYGSAAATTDADGRWRLDTVPPAAAVELTVKLSHPDFASDEAWGQSQEAAAVTTAMLRDGTATLTLKRGVALNGWVTAEGKPAAGAVVVPGQVLDGTATDGDGRYRLPAMAPKQMTVTVLAADWAPQSRRVNLQSDPPVQDFQLRRGQTIRLRVVDAAGRPVPDAAVLPVELLGARVSENVSRTAAFRSIPRTAGTAGVWEWAWAPADPVKLRVSAKGYAVAEVDIAGGAPEQTVTLKAEFRIAGRVTDEVTGKPIPAFAVIPVDVFRKDFLHAERYNAVPGRDGRLSFLAHRTDIAVRLRVEAPGYRTQDGPEFRLGDDAARTQHFRLKPSQPIAGVVLDAAGQPAAGAQVLLATPTSPANLDETMSNQTVRADAGGRFTFPDPGEAFAVVARSDAGFALAEFPADRADAGELRLRPWASVRGRFRDGGRPVAGATLYLTPVRSDALDRPRVETRFQAVTGPDGHFEFPRVPPGAAGVWVSLGPWEDPGFRSGPRVPLDVQPGGRADLDLGGAGAAVSGRVKLTGTVPAGLDCTYSINHLIRRAPGVVPPSEVVALGFDVRNGWRAAWLKSAEGRTYFGTLQSWFVKLAPDGGFRVSGVPPGEYDLAVAVYAKPSGCLVDPLAEALVRVTVTEADAARGTLALPEVAAAVAPVPAVGDTPALAFRRADGTDGSLADARGKLTLVHFWASWCGPCKQQLPAVRRLHERYAARGLAALGLSLDEDEAAWRAASAKLDAPWPQGRLVAGGGAGVSSVPAYWLLDAAGKIVAKASDADELGTLLGTHFKPDR